MKIKNEKETLDEFMGVYGWQRYYDSWIRYEWIKNGDPYDRMATPFDEAFKNAMIRYRNKYFDKGVEAGKKLMK